MVSDPFPAQAGGALGDGTAGSGVRVLLLGSLCRLVPAVRCAEEAFHGSVPTDVQAFPL